MNTLITITNEKLQDTMKESQPYGKKYIMNTFLFHSYNLNVK